MKGGSVRTPHGKRRDQSAPQDARKRRMSCQGSIVDKTARMYTSQVAEYGKSCAIQSAIDPSMNEAPP